MHLWQSHLSMASQAANVDYFQKPRFDILPFITWTPEVVLDVGCGSGATGSLLIDKYPGCQVYGIEKNRQAAKNAENIYKQVIVCDVENIDADFLDLPLLKFDTVLLLDVLEHLFNPWQFLFRLSSFLVSKCRIIASIPNSFNIQLLDELSSGRWQYAPDGLLDITHIRFFCEEDIRQMFVDAGFFVAHIANLPHPISRLPKPIYRQADHVETNHIVIKNICEKEIFDLFALQKVVVATLDSKLQYEAPDSTFDLSEMIEEGDSPYQSLRNTYLDMVRKCVLGMIYEDASLQPHTGAQMPFEIEKRENGLDWPSSAHSMIGHKRMLNAQHLAEYVITHGVSGDFIETGVWRGGTCIMLRAVLRAYNVHDRFVWVADSFEGLPKPSPDVYPADAGDCHHKYSELAIPLEQVKDNFSRYGLLDKQVKFLKGWFRDTLPTAPIEKIALLRLDGDMYESTMDALKHLFPKVSYGGFVIIDDYNYIHSCKMAVDEFRSKYSIVDPIHEIDQFGVYWQNLFPNYYTCKTDETNDFFNKSHIPLDKNHSDRFIPQNTGYCYCCRSNVNFKEYGSWLRDFYVCGKCSSIPRFRHLMYVLDNYLHGWEESCLHEVEPCHSFIATRSQNYSSSIFTPSVASGLRMDGKLCENLEKLSFADNTFDLFITQDIMTLVFNPKLMMQEIIRVLKPGGSHVFTLPRNIYLKQSRPRAELDEYGGVSNLMQAIYFGAVTPDNKYLVKWEYGLDLEDLIFEWCQQSTKTYRTKDRSLGIDGEFSEVFVIKKHLTAL